MTEKQRILFIKHFKESQRGALKELKKALEDGSIDHAYKDLGHSRWVSLIEVDLHHVYSKRPKH